MNSLPETIVKVGKKGIWRFEKHIKVYIQPKPKYLPNFIWYKILKRLVVLEYTIRDRRFL